MRFPLVVLAVAFLCCGYMRADDQLDVALSPPDFDLSDIEDLDESDEKLLRELEEKNAKPQKVVDRENEIDSNLVSEAVDGHSEVLNAVTEIDPCDKIQCGLGRVCQIVGEHAKCVCIPECPEVTDERRHVCTNKSETWPSDCSVYQQRCLCETKAEGCRHPDNVRMHIDYYGVCREHMECSEEDMTDFPRRMRDWLFNVMRDLAERDELTEHYMQMELEAETNVTRRWAIAAAWKWCDLDGDTDRAISRPELFPIRAPLVTLEHCIAPFLDSCDANNDQRITLQEWGACLQLEESELVAKCDNIHRAAPHLMG